MYSSINRGHVDKPEIQRQGWTLDTVAIQRLGMYMYMYRQFNDDSGHTGNSTVIIIVVHPYFTQTYRNTTCSKLCPTTAKQISNGMTHVRMNISHRDWAINRPNQ